MARTPHQSPRRLKPVATPQPPPCSTRSTSIDEANIPAAGDIHPGCSNYPSQFSGPSGVETIRSIFRAYPWLLWRRIPSTSAQTADVSGCSNFPTYCPSDLVTHVFYHDSQSS